MDKIDQTALLHACQALLKPIASFLMKCGMTWREFADISKSVFVEVAGADYGIKSRPTNVARVSLLTGISRKEVKRQRELLAQPQPVEAPVSKASDATRVLSGWHQDSVFHNTDGQPKTLRLEGEGASFAELCRRYAGDIPMTTMLKELRRTGAVAETEPGKLAVEQRYYMPAHFDPQWILSAGSAFADLGDNLNHNLTAGGDTPSRFLGRAMDPTIDAAAIPEFREFIESLGQSFLEQVDDWLAEHRSKDGGNGRQVRLGVGLFLIQDENLERNP